MKIERMSDNKIKVTVSGDDVRIWNVDLKNFTDNTPEAQDMFWFALKQAEQDVNFTVGQSQLLVETMPAGESGFVMIVSRLENETDVVEALLKAGKKVRQTEMGIKRRRRALPPVKIYKFDDFEALCRAASELHGLYTGESRLFKYGGAFYLELLPRDSFGFFELENMLSEFAERVKKPFVMQGVLSEHGLLMVECDAVLKIAQNFAD